MPVVDVNSLTFEPITLTASDFTASRDNNTSLSAGTVGEIATAEVGEDGQLSGYEAVQIGQPEVNSSGDRKGNELFMQLADGADAEVADTVQAAVAARQKGELGGGAAGSITGWIKHRGQDTTDPAQRQPIYPQTPVVKDGRLVQFLAKDETSSVTVNIDSTATQLEIPALGGK